ncbi:hypothetical protein A3H85_02865 [Candidatus Daviesbacteria bacterium RIFCSPLOWO2_02_FULL_40_8]|uniref:Response regulatory domain-containing protein n=1 Tax=Candidatus Daviesbacteria bacterium RIFCSPLOWO2_01_FULL_40_24 TaxID=1797787 RepID=A0A1F5MIC3_9BACT|nr:MAG: hypothetical protein A2780_03775 [Candidatus Daviesbacteria bacterium RIFCSPHIGHO2_01_FULL_41_45]OGE65126.1 MAG: hypothetical protein A3B49_03090 [Candidatus Daviesbacteria bacterium RIFCSPLOWO2_01_FULL_40_24]OGE66090.1 MAG: hypothetical protein A3H85_02865 [Candidatus Daviesbacteria bacterium RIFCSPLOWO2_02_FULL_40_8]
MKVLIIEDEKAMSDLIAIKFKVEGFEVDQAFNLAEGKQKLLVGGYDAVLSDYLLPDGNALDMISEVRSNPIVTNVPIIMATNYIEDLSQDKAKELRIAEVIVKYQVVPAQMVQKIKNLISPSAPTPGPAQITATPEPPAPPSPLVQQPVLPTSPTQGAVPPAPTTPDPTKG